eukprot:CAMPEP_0178377412 /NCGR_PEP_ID=MMETSP0689_2-20121128/3905_1 /TAXON_ID=160604 /ORGANISM="Amphidinium massartii, Strain CS-259" /LENGTH=75 /DNA_ID=CAMNT_0019997465 /DNA_START=203 /DNA_END=434 /DNA_ORIENTATION=+
MSFGLRHGISPIRVENDSASASSSAKAEDAHVTLEAASASAAREQSELGHVQQQRAACQPTSSELDGGCTTISMG